MPASPHLSATSHPDALTQTRGKEQDLVENLPTAGELDQQAFSAEEYKEAYRKEAEEEVSTSCP